ncbi:MFS transporter [Streptomyces sp. NBC_00201]|uniref:MFS transporter n=1 Tax=unclassified Streptomyces TaxID=2593676 RepID=UPI00225869AE|nr:MULTISPECIES: MFS transporter [unclassified Streptomyces]MCX5057810.1 MFS transporter [Streptomyces sp. NBC_00452]MCX5245312.1 MFS transporter [Streptomyces sp. NBC_00201]MCX5288910.1 MFS transporter [Streptomyces sp. NBC_00183]
MTTTLAPRGGLDDRPAHRDPNVLRWLGAYASSMAGDGVYYVALSWAAVQAGSATQAGLVMSVSALPRAVLMLGGGVVADRFGPRRVVIGSDAVRCASVLAVAGLLLLTGPGLWLLAVLALVFGTVDAVFVPAVGALPARITEPGQLARVQGMRGLAYRCAVIVGAPLGGLGVAVGGAAAAFGLAGLLIAVSVPLLVCVRMRELPADDTVAGRDRTAWADLLAGLRYIRRHRVLAPLVLAIALGDFGFVGPLNVGLTLLADERGWGASGMGWVLAGFGVGAGLVSLLLAVRGRLPHAGQVSGYALLAGAVAIAALAFVPTLLAAVAVALAVGLLAGLSGAMCGALLQTQADPAFLGRVTAVSSLVSLGLTPLSMPLSAAAIGAWGTGPVFVVSAVVCGLGGVVALGVRDLRRAELPG